MQNRREYIVKHLASMSKNTHLFDQFQQIVNTQGLFVDERILRAVHTRVSEYAFRAYTKRINNEDFNKIKTLASDKTNLAFRIEVQVGGCNEKKESKAESTSTSEPRSNLSKAIISELNVKTRGKNKTKDQKTEEYQVPYNNAIKKLKKAQELKKKETPNATLNPISAKLTKRECAAVLTIGFATFTNENSTTKVDTMRRDLLAKISEGVSGEKFWQTMNEAPTQS